MSAVSNAVLNHDLAVESTITEKADLKFADLCIIFRYVVTHLDWYPCSSSAEVRSLLVPHFYVIYFPYDQRKPT